MNKKGFTLIELVVSIGLLSLALVFMSATIVYLRNLETSSGMDTKVLVSQSIISKKINSDLINNFMKYYGDDCDNNGKEYYDCMHISYSGSNGGFSKELRLYNETDGGAKTLYYGNETSAIIQTLPKGFSFGKIQVKTVGSGNVLLEKIIIPINSSIDSKMNFNIEAYGLSGIINRTYDEYLSNKFKAFTTGTEEDFAKKGSVGKLISVKDEEGLTSYAFRGNVKNNFVSFASKTWKITRINSDGSVRMILDGYVTQNYKYTDMTFKDENDAKKKMVFKLTNIYNILNEWLNSYISNIADTNLISKETKFCTDLTFESKNRLGKASLKCSENGIYTGMVGILSADEIAIAGAIQGSSNTEFYLYNKTPKPMWTSSPFFDSLSSSVNMIYLKDDGSFDYSPITNALYIAPVISLKYNTVVESGDGTITNPFVIKSS